jgi:hypothetical protein
MYREPKGAMGRSLDKIVTKISFYEGISPAANFPQT